MLSYPPGYLRDAGLEERNETTMSETSVYGAASTTPAKPRRAMRVHHLAQMKADGEKWSMLTAYDYSTARIFDDAGIPVLLVGDSAANVVYGYDTTIPVTLDEMIPLIRGVVRGARTHSVVADLTFGSYEAGPQQASNRRSAFSETGAHAVKLEGGERVADQIATHRRRHPRRRTHRFHPQSVNGLGGFRVQGRGDGADQLIADAIAVQEAGAIAVVMEMVPADLAGQITRKLTIPTVGIGAGNETDAQVLVWQDMAGFTHGRTAKFVKRFADVGGDLRKAAEQYADEVREASSPAPNTPAESLNIAAAGQPECQNPSVWSWCDDRNRTANHDALFRLVFGDPDNTASELRSVLPPRLTARINLDNLRPQPGTFVDPELPAPPHRPAVPDDHRQRRRLPVPTSNTSAHPTQRWHSDDDLPNPHLGNITAPLRPRMHRYPDHPRRHLSKALAAGPPPPTSPTSSTTTSKPTPATSCPTSVTWSTTPTTLDDAALRARPSLRQPASPSSCSPKHQATTTSPPGSANGSTTSST